VEPKEALFWEKLDEKTVRCTLCPHNCVIRDGSRGLCRGRENRGGKLVALTFAQTIALHNDPVEKKPLYHFYPGSYLLSLGPNACNFACKHCQNWEISQMDVPTSHIDPQRAVKTALGAKDCIGLSFTYTEPLVWFEYVLQTSILAREKGLKTTLVTNGYINPEPAAQILPYIDGINLDIKSMDDDFYRSVCRGTLGPVLEFAKLAKKHSHLEITNLVIPTLNDRPDQIERLVNWVFENLGEDTPLHFTRYFPHYKMGIEPTPVSTLTSAYQIAKRRMRFVYVGNVLDSTLNSTYCPRCGSELVSRSGYYVKVTGLSDSKCARCGEQIPIVV